MSSHRISASGDRPTTITSGGPFGAWQVPSQRTDAINANLSGFSKFEAVLGGDARIEWREVKRNTSSQEEEQTFVFPVLVIENGSLQVFGWPSGDAEVPGPENTNIDIRKPDERFGPLSYYGEATVVETLPISATVSES